MDKFAKSLFVCVGGVAKYQPFDEDDGSEVADAAKAREDVSAPSVPYSCEQCGHRGSVATVAQNKVGRRKRKMAVMQAAQISLNFADDADNRPPPAYCSSHRSSSPISRLISKPDSSFFVIAKFHISWSKLCPRLK